MTRPPKNTKVKTRLPMSTDFQRCGAYVLVIFNWRLVNSDSSEMLQSSREGISHCGTKCIGDFASCNTRVTVKSSDTVPRHRSLTRNRSNVARRMAVEPPQQKFLSRSAPRADAIEAFHTERRCEAKLPLDGMNQR